MHKDINVNVSGPQQPASTYKTKVLKGQVPFAVQVTEPNTKYVIKHNFELDGDVTIPENCILEFDGGSISGEHTITANSTIIVRNSDDIIKDGAKFVGSIITNDYIPVEWYGAKGDGTTDDSAAILNAIQSNVKIKFKDDAVYGFDDILNTIQNISGFVLFADNNATLKYLHEPQFDSGTPNNKNFIRFLNCEDFEIKNLTFDLNQTWVERPLTESGESWEHYMDVRNKSCSNVGVISSQKYEFKNCQFTGGLNSIANRRSNNFKFYNCTFTRTIADSFYICDESHDAIVENCFASYNGDDTYCVNVADGNVKPPYNVTFINCNGDNLYGALGCVAGGQSVTYINCNGICKRTAGLRVESVNPSVYNGDLGNVEFIGCKVVLNKDMTITSNYLTYYLYNIVFENCTFEKKNVESDSVFRIYAMRGLIFNNCHFKNISIYPDTDSETTFNNCLIESPNNCSIRSAYDTKITNCRFRNKGLIADRKHEDRVDAETSERSCINLLRGKGKYTFVGNSYAYVGDDAEPPTFYAIRIDDYSADMVGVQLDTSNFKQPNNSNQHIYYPGVIDKTLCKIENIVSLIDTQMWLSSSGKLYMKVNGTEKVIIDFNA